MNRLFFIGDVHGKFHALKLVFDRIRRVLSEFETAQVVILGDIGLFIENDRDILNKIIDSSPSLSVTRIPGNHDNPKLFSKISQNNPKLFPRFSQIQHSYRFLNVYNQDVHISLLGGGHSVDKHLRTEGKDWFSEEIPNPEEVDNFFNCICERDEVKIFATHECPDYVVKRMYPGQGPDDKFDGITPYESPLALMFNGFIDMNDDVLPRYWLYGHHHRSYTTELYGVEFICLDELQCIELDTQLDTITII